jgi:hypothetical protein
VSDSQIPRPDCFAFVGEPVCRDVGIFHHVLQNSPSRKRNL